MLRILSWNVNGLRSCAKKGFCAWLARSESWFVGLQEVRAQPDQLDASLVEPDSYKFCINSAQRPGYSGVAIYSQRAPDSVDTSLGEERFDCEGRLQIAHFGHLHIANVYFPNGNGKNRDLSRIPYKLDFYNALREHLEPYRKAGEPVLVLGDFNTAHQEIDLARPKQNKETSGFRPEEREALDAWMRTGWVDTFRHFESAGGHYSWWSQRQGVRERNIGWRIDYVLASRDALPYVKNAFILPTVMGSDHCPVGVDVDAHILETHST